jgi:hypothetical protein
MQRNLATLLTLIFILIVLGFSKDALAQKDMRGNRGRGWNNETKYGRMYDLKTVETITATVLNVEKIIPSKGMSYGVHLTVKTDQETLSVHLGPGWFIDNQDIKIEEKDKLEIRGSRIDFKGEPAIIAAEVEKGDQTLELRDESGFPVWSGWKRRSFNKD